MVISQVLGAAARLDRLPILAFHRRLLVLVGAGLFFDAFDIYLANSVLGSLVKSGWSTLQLNATFLSATAIGMLVGSIMAGILGDRYGRKFSYQFNLALFGLASFACALAPNMTWLIAARFICGVGLGAELVIGYGLLSEFVPPSHRGRWAALLSCMAQFGLFFSTLTSWLVIPAFGWRAMFLIAGVGALMVFFARKVIPESPRWLESNGRIDEARKIVADIEAGADAASLPPPALVAALAPTAKVGVFDGRLRQPLLLGALTQVIQSVAIYGFVAWVPTFLVKQGMPVNQTLGLTVLMSFGGPAGALLAFLLTDRVGRRPAIIGGSLLAAALGPLFALASSQLMAIVLGFAIFSLIYFLVSVIQAGYLPELFPTAVRMRATSLCVTAGRVTSIGLPFAIVALFEWQGVMAVVGLVSVLLVIQTVAVLLLGRETRGQSLEAIADIPGGAAAMAAGREVTAS
jgi:putative MFS transporter